VPRCWRRSRPASAFALTGGWCRGHVATPPPLPTPRRPRCAAGRWDSTCRSAHWRLSPRTCWGISDGAVRTGRFAGHQCGGALLCLATVLRLREIAPGQYARAASLCGPARSGAATGPHRVSVWATGCQRPHPRGTCHSCSTIFQPISTGASLHHADWRGNSRGGVLAIERLGKRRVGRIPAQD